MKSSKLREMVGRDSISVVVTLVTVPVRDALIMLFFSATVTISASSIASSVRAKGHRS